MFGGGQYFGGQALRRYDADVAERTRVCGWVKKITTFGGEEVWEHASNCHCPPDDEQRAPTPPVVSRQPAEPPRS